MQMSLANATVRPRTGRAFAVPAALCALVGMIGGLLFVLSMAYDAAANWTHPLHQPPTSTPADYGLAYEDVRLVTEDGLRLTAWYIPTTNGAALIFLHGLGGNRGAIWRWPATWPRAAMDCSSRICARTATARERSAPSA